MDNEAQTLIVNNLEITFNGKEPFKAVKNISFNVPAGKTLAVVGESGSGKSLTALAIMGLLPANASVNGHIALHTGARTISLTSLTNAREWQAIRGKEAGMVFQEPMSSLNPVISIGEQLTEAITAHTDMPHKEGMQRAIDWLGQVQLPEPAKIYKRFPHQLSGGQKQRVMIAMAMCNHPALLIADEPTTALDVTVQQEIVRLMHYLQQQHNTSMIFITHDLALAASIADEVLIMYKGDVVECGEAELVLKHPVHPYTKALLACKPSAQQKGKRLPVVADFLEADKARPDTMLNEMPATQTTISSNKILEVKKLNVWFTERTSLLGKPERYFKAVNDVSFYINQGEVLGLVGESGCGKSTLSRSLIGLIPVHDGAIIYKGADITHKTPKEWGKIRNLIQMIFQDPYASLNPRLTVEHILTEPMRVHHIVPVADLRREALRLLDMVQLPSTALNRYAHQFSGGQRQRIGIARALALRPELIICDESVSALDVSIQAQILNLLKELQHELGLSYLFISHDLAVVHYISDRVMVMKAGKIVETGDAEQVLKYPANDYTKKLIAAMPQL